MDDNDKSPSQEPKTDKKLMLDLSEAGVQSTDDDDDDDIIELKDEIELPPKPKEAKIDSEDRIAADQPHHKPATEKIIALDSFEEETDDQEGLIRLPDDLTFEEEDQEEMKTLPPVSEKILKEDAAGDVMEITEFDDIFSEESNELVTLSDADEAMEPEEEFLELIDVEEDDLTEEGRKPEMDLAPGHEEIEDEIIQFDSPDEDAEDVELEDFINDSLGEQIRMDDGFEEDLTNALEPETESEMDLADSSSDAEEFDFSMESDEISEKIDQLDTIFFEDSESENELDEETESEGTEAAVLNTDDETEDEEEEEEEEEVPGLELQEEPQANEVNAALLDASQDQIEKSIEQIVEQKFHGKIESMIREIIEKAVSKEIDRLKNILLEDDSAEDR